MYTVYGFDWDKLDFEYNFDSFVEALICYKEIEAIIHFLEIESILVYNKELSHCTVSMMRDKVNSCSFVRN